MNPLVSIVIPVYNGSNYLDAAINSALAQTYKNCEIIVVNDGSDDEGKTEEICLNYGSKIRYFGKENGGVASAINIGIKNMRGEYFAWLSHDDMFYPTKIQEQIEALESGDDINKIVFGNFEFLDMQSGTKTGFKIENFCAENKITKGIYPIMFGLIHFCTMLVPRSRILEVGLCNESLKTTQDIEWIFRLLRNKESIFIKKPLTIVRLHTAQGKHQIKEYVAEQAEIHISFMRSISRLEMEELFGGELAFFEQMATFYKRDNNIQAFEFARKMFNELPKPIETIETIEKVKQKIYSFADRNTDKVCIFGAGFYGMSLLYEFRKRLIGVDFFSDNDSKKWGKNIDGLTCIPPNEIGKKNTLIIAALETADELVQELIDAGYKFVITYKDIINDLLSALPIYIPD